MCYVYMYTSKHRWCEYGYDHLCRHVCVCVHMCVQVGEELGIGILIFTADGLMITATIYEAA